MAVLFETPAPAEFIWMADGVDNNDKAIQRNGSVVLIR